MCKMCKMKRPFYQLYIILTRVRYVYLSTLYLYMLFFYLFIFLTHFYFAHFAHY